MIRELRLDGAHRAGPGWLVRRREVAVGDLAGIHPAGLPPSGDIARQAAPLVRAGSLAGREGGRIVFLDLETSGLRGSGTLAWCVGLAMLGPSDADAETTLSVEQHVLEHPDAEPAMLDAVVARLGQCDLLITFNGRCFDVPLLESRCVMQRRRLEAGFAHLDLLPPARRLLARGDARLSSIEKRLGRERHDDIDGADVPRAWFDWLRLGEGSDLARAADHNHEDLLAMVAMLSWLLAASAGEAAARAMADPLGLAEIGLRRGEHEAVIELLAASDPDDEVARVVRRGRLLRRAGGRAAAKPAWEQLVERGAGTAEAWESLAKLLEHDERDLARARDVVREALRRIDDPAAESRLEHRLARLERRLAAGSPHRPSIPPAPALHVDSPDGPGEPHAAWKSSRSVTRFDRLRSSGRS